MRFGQIKTNPTTAAATAGDGRGPRRWVS